MSIIANEKIINELKEQLIDKLTFKQMEMVVKTVADVIATYDINEILCEDVQNDAYLEAYLNAISVEGRSEKTLQHYRYQLTRFLKSVSCTSGKITAYHIRKYLSEQKARGISDTTIKGHCWVLSAYFGWLHRDGLISKNPMANIGTVKTQKKVKEVYSDIEIEKLKNGCKTIRDKAIICFLKSTGCRISEMIGLDRDCLSMNGKRVIECKVLGKGNKERIVYLNSVTGMIIQEYLDGRKDDNPALFVGRGGKRLQANGVRVMLRRLGKATGVKHVHPHKFRRTEITELVNRGMPIEQVAKLMGHENLDTTLGYIVMDQDNVKNNYQKYA